MMNLEALKQALKHILIDSHDIESEGNKIKMKSKQNSKSTDFVVTLTKQNVMVNVRGVKKRYKPITQEQLVSIIKSFGLI